MSKKEKPSFHLFGGKKQKGDNEKSEVKTIVRRGGVVKIALDWHLDAMGEKTVVFKKYQPQVQGNKTIGIFIAGGASVDKAVREANVRCMSKEGVIVP